MRSLLLRRLRASPFCFLALWAAMLPATAADLVRHGLAAADYEAVRQILVESIESEGLIPGPVSQFGAMLQRSADLGHGGDIYRRAEIFTFCSIAVSSRLVQEDPDRIADCPLTIALYELKDSGEVRIAYRHREGDTPATRAANDLLRRIAERTTAQFSP